MAVAAGDVGRAEHVAAILQTLPTTCSVTVQEEGARGMTLLASAAAVAGSVLLEVPLAACVTSRDLDGHTLSGRLPPDDSFGRLLTALLLTMDGHDHGEADSRAEYYAKVVPLDFFDASMMACWEDDDLSQRLANSCSWKRAVALRREAEDERRALSEEGLCVPFARYLWAKLVVQTRAVSTGGPPGHVLVPLLDLANHRSVGANARMRLMDDAMQLLALEDVDAGDELTYCYDPAADFLDLFERYGFFDDQSCVHTVEVTVPRAALLGSGGEPGGPLGEQRTGAEGWRRALVEAQAEQGCNTALDAWWVPAVAIEACPLFSAVRATLITEKELAEPEPAGGIEPAKRAADAGGAAAELPGGSASHRLRSPIQAEVEVRARMARLLAHHLAGYSTTLLQDAAALEQVWQASPRQAAALRLLLFEKTLLHQQLEALRAVA